jgi:hypothetical protein
MNNITYDDTDVELDYFILENIYLDLCFKIARNEDLDLDYDENYIYLSTIPDFIIGNEKKFINHKSEEYKTFINTKIKHYLDNKNEYNHKPSIIVLLKLIDLFDKEQDDDELIILYNRVLNMINYMHSDDLFINEEYVKHNNSYKIITHRAVKESTIIQVYDNLPLLEDFNKFVKKIFQQKKDNYDLLLSELNYMDTLDLNDNKYNNLKFNIFLAALYQYIVVKPEPLDLIHFFNKDTVQNVNSIKFSVFMAWYIYQKIKNNYKGVVEIHNFDLNINKFYGYLIALDSEILKKMLNYITNSDYTPVNTFNIEELFNNGRFKIDKYDYQMVEIESSIKPLNKVPLMREQLVYGGGHKTNIPISPLGVIYKYVRFIGY